MEQAIPSIFNVVLIILHRPFLSIKCKGYILSYRFYFSHYRRRRGFHPRLLGLSVAFAAHGAARAASAAGAAAAAGAFALFPVLSHAVDDQRDDAREHQDDRNSSQVCLQPE
jgi:hypothetical protein